MSPLDPDEISARRAERSLAQAPDLTPEYPDVDPEDLAVFEAERRNWSFKDIVDREA